MLSFREDESDREDKGSFTLGKCLVRDCATKQLFPDSGPNGNPVTGADESTYRDRPNSFEIFSFDGSVLFRNHRSLVVCAESSEEKESWIRAISDAIQFARTREPGSGIGSIGVPLGGKSSSNLTNGGGQMGQMPAQMTGADLSHSQAFTAASLGPATNSVYDSADNMTVLLVRMLLHSYFVIVRKHIQDLVPKAIMCMLCRK
jgi:hypothetical protein